ncbi:hypothetical protein Pyn_22164 [Prunus yedoensis var. nudiflora]|uniref:Uncharacterized protein n=1 Tax=Prunus yedoensis var. nudiflora TaxID=2094558 RepID=A0A314Z166_PRUYE|nr:hypothetical protein Pyn_22164 [Prunus yedoensis var. nudiflora]
MEYPLNKPFHSSPLLNIINLPKKYIPTFNNLENQGRSVVETRQREMVAWVAGIRVGMVAYALP